MTALLEYHDLDCCIKVSQIQSQIILEGAKPHIIFFKGATAPLAPPCTVDRWL